MKLNKDISDAFKLIMEKAQKSRDDAGMSGRYDDGGYREKKDQIETFKDGIRYEREGIIPEWLKEVIKEVQDKQDPEYIEYMRLKEKFE